METAFWNDKDDQMNNSKWDSEKEKKDDLNSANFDPLKPNVGFAWSR